MRRIAGLVALVAALAGCGGGDDRRQAYEEYVTAANRAQAQFAPGFRQAQQAIARFASGTPTKRTAERLRHAASTIRAAHASLLLIQPPEDARELHEDVLRLLDLQARLSLELSLAAEYVPEVAGALREPDAAGARLRSSLGTARLAEEQVTALRRYSDDLKAALNRLDALTPPPALAPWHQAQTQRLEASRALALELASSVAAGRPDAVERAMRAYTAAAPDDTALARAQKAAVRAFNRQLDRQQRLHARIVREELRLADDLSK